VTEVRLAGHTTRIIQIMFVRLFNVLLFAASAFHCSSEESWAFRSLGSTAKLPLVAAWGSNAVDSFISEKLIERGLTPSQPTDRATLIRRVHLTVLGLPPSPDEIDVFLNDTAPDAYNRLLDRVLSSPRFGERWAQHWMDVIRFAETWGFETNAFREQAYHYRNWLIEFLNDDLPFERFVMEQIAGDATGVDAATGFLVAGPANLPGQIGKDIESQRQARQDELDEVIKTVSEGFWGLTVACARCHDHKFDPIPQRDYYALQAVFSGLRYGHRRLRGEENLRWAQGLPATRAKLEGLRDEREAKRQRWNLRPSINSASQEHSFAKRTTDAIRIVINATANGGAPSLHEVEVWSSEEESRNVALALNGGKPTASSYSLNANQSRHPDNLVDGRAEFPWVADASGPAWVQIQLPGLASINRVIWKQGGASFPVDYQIELINADGEWEPVADPYDQMLHLDDRRALDSIRLNGVEPEAISEILRLNREITQTEAERRRLTAGPQVFAGFFQTPENTFKLRRGDPMQRREAIGPDLPSLFGSLNLGAESKDLDRRIALARSIASHDRPLAWRVMVNRTWQHYFGTGLVKTPSDFGFRGGDPSHPELLDWLVRRWQESGGNFKSLHRLILGSVTFQQAGQSRSKALSIDAESRWLWRFPPRLLEAESLRDAILSASGNLNLKMFGEGFNFFHNRGGLSDYRPKVDFGEEEFRRMVYSTKMRMTSVEIFGAFNCPDAGQMTAARSQSVTPIQALNLFNSQFVVTQAKAFSDRVISTSSGDLNESGQSAIRIAFGREATAEELAELVDLAAEHGLESVCRVLLNASDFVMLR
jgi:hypothetical protein